VSELRRLHVAARYSEAAVFNGVVYLAGMVPECDATDIAAQTADVLAQVDRRLAECGSDRTRILRAQIFLADIADIGAMNAVWDAWGGAGFGARQGPRYRPLLPDPALAHRGRGHGGCGAPINPDLIAPTDHPTMGRGQKDLKLAQ
jgi:enamine deaminase RidA (YjgF/YER057c/UK114 family)